MPFIGPLQEHVLMPNHYHAIVWIDHEQAKVVHFNKDSSQSVVVRSSNSRTHLHHKANSTGSGHAPTDRKYLERVATAIASTGAILVVGPAHAKTEFVTHLKRSHPAIAARISAVEAMDHPTDGQLLAH